MFVSPCSGSTRSLQIWLFLLCHENLAEIFLHPLVQVKCINLIIIELIPVRLEKCLL